MDDSKEIRTIGVIGGGSAGYLAALTLRKFLPDAEITLLESPKVPVLGVGEATTSEMPPFLYKVLGIDITDFYRGVQPTWKLGIRFEWGETGNYYFNYPFDTGSAAESQEYDGNILNCTLESVLMSRNLTPVMKQSTSNPLSLMPLYPYAYHIDNRRLLTYLQDLARSRGIGHIACTIADVVRAADSDIAAVVRDDGQQHAFDFFIDCTGFRSSLLEKELGSPFVSYGSTLFTDSALFGNAPHGGVVRPYTTAHTMNNGWAWTIPQRDEDHLGYVYSSRFTSDEDAEAEFRRTYPGLGAVRRLRFRSGRHAEFIKGNVAAIGNSYGFVEPLESTGLFVICRQSLMLGMALSRAGGRLTNSLAKAANSSIADVWDYIRWFLAIHYRFNGRLDTPFWRACRSDTDISGIEPVIERYRDLGSLAYSTADLSIGGTINFSAFGHDVLLMGQRVPARRTGARESREAYRRRVEGYEEIAKSALDQVTALRYLEERDAMLLEPLRSENSWMTKFMKSIVEVCEEALSIGSSRETSLAPPDEGE